MKALWVVVVLAALASNAHAQRPVLAGDIDVLASSTGTATASSGCSAAPCSLVEAFKYIDGLDINGYAVILDICASGPDQYSTGIPTISNKLVGQNGGVPGRPNFVGYAAGKFTIRGLPASQDDCKIWPTDGTIAVSANSGAEFTLNGVNLRQIQNVDAGGNPLGQDELNLTENVVARILNVTFDDNVNPGSDILMTGGAEVHEAGSVRIHKSAWSVMASYAWPSPTVTFASGICPPTHAMVVGPNLPPSTTIYSCSEGVAQLDHDPMTGSYSGPVVVALGGVAHIDYSGGGRFYVDSNGGQTAVPVTIDGTPGYVQGYLYGYAGGQAFMGETYLFAPTFGGSVYGPQYYVASLAALFRGWTNIPGPCPAGQPCPPNQDMPGGPGVVVGGFVQ